MKPIEAIIGSLRVAMTDARQNESHFESWMILNEAICNAIDALAKQSEEQHEPMAWQYSFTHSSAIGHGDYDIGPVVTDKKDVAFGIGCFGQLPLYPSPQPSKPWVGLTDEELPAMWKDAVRKAALPPNKSALIHYKETIEAKLREKNELV